jgi:hypothetical protein
MLEGQQRELQVAAPLHGAVAPKSGRSNERLERCSVVFVRPRIGQYPQRSSPAYHQLCTNLYHNTLPSLAERKKERKKNSKNCRMKKIVFLDVRMEDGCLNFYLPFSPCYFVARLTC